MNVIKTKKLTKIYDKYDKNKKALDDVNLNIKPNKIYGLLGRNGAGKTTLLNLMTDKIFPTEGEITIGDENVIENERILSSVFYMMQNASYNPAMKVKELFKWGEKFYAYFDLEYATKLAKKFKLDINKKIQELSTGYNTIFKVILTLASNAEILLFDEPILGLDANHRDMFYKELLKNYNNKLKTIIISTHLIDEIADIIEEVIIIKEGKIIREESVEKFLTSAYTLAGSENKIDKYLEDKKFITEESIGTLKVVTVLEDSKEKNENLAKELDLEFANIELQKLFISLTNYDT